jgi:hypothetical protein
MARHRRTGSRNWARGLFATFWILLGGLSGAYLFTAFTNPTALGGQLVALNASGGTTPASDGTTAAIGTEPPQTSEQEIAEINERLRQLTEQVAALNTRFKSAEKAPGPVAALAPTTSVTAPTSDAQPAAPATETKPPEVAAAPPPSPPAEPPAEEVKPAPAEEPKPAEAPKEEPKPVEQAAVAPAEEVKPAPAPATPSEPPPVAVSPLEEDAPAEGAMPAAEVPAPSPPATVQETPAPETPAAAPPAATESAALDPIALPPAANDGSTRYGIEIGTVGKQDALRPLWREFLTNHAALVAGLQPRRVLAPDKKWRLIAGPFGSADEASQACALFKKASRPCEATVYAGDAL